MNFLLVFQLHVLCPLGIVNDNVEYNGITRDDIEAVRRIQINERIRIVMLSVFSVSLKLIHHKNQLHVLSRSEVD